MGPVEIKYFNLAGDEQADLNVHGGMFKAVYGYPSEHYPFWKGILNLPDLPYGALGENLTTAGLDEETIFIGNIYKIGSAILQVSQPRTPCYKLNIRFGRPDAMEMFFESNRPGMYFSIIEQGMVEAGDNIELIEEDIEKVNLEEAFKLYLGKSFDMNLLEKLIRVKGLSDNWRFKFRHLLNNVPS